MPKFYPTSKLARKRWAASNRGDPSSRPVADRPRPGPNSYGMRSSGSSLGELVPARPTNNPATLSRALENGSGVIDGTSRLVRQSQMRNGSLAMGYGLRRALGLAFGGETSAALRGGLSAFMNMLPGFAKDLGPGFGVAQNYGNLPLFRNWSADAPAFIRIESLATATTRQTGQAMQMPHPAIYHKATGGPDSYVSIYSQRFVAGALNQWRSDEVRTYGPAPASYVATHWTGHVQTGNPPRTFPTPVPWPLIPYRPQTDTWSGGYGQTPTPPVIPNFVPRRPPGPKTKENKLRANSRLQVVLRALGGTTEFFDLVDAFYDALPKELQKCKRGRKSFQCKANAVYRHWDKVDLDTALFNAAWANLVEDRISGMMGVPTKPFGRSQGTNVGVNKLLQEANGRQVSDLLKAAKQRFAESLNQIPGVSIQGKRK